jgi:hypothetical protein
VLVDIGVQPVAGVFGIRDSKEVDETWRQGSEQHREGPPAPECELSGSGRGVATPLRVFAVGVLEEPGQAQVEVSTNSLTTSPDANLRV